MINKTNEINNLRNLGVVELNKLNNEILKELLIRKNKIKRINKI